MIFRICLAFVFAFTSSFAIAGTKPKPKSGKIPITALEFHTYVLNAFQSRKSSGKWMETLPDHFSKSDKEKLKADLNRNPKGPDMSVEDGAIHIKDMDGTVTTLKLYEFGPQQIVMYINGKKVILNPKSSYVEMRKQLLKEITGNKSASFSLGILPEAQAVTVVGAIAIFAIIVGATWLIWSTLRHLWRCLNKTVGNRRVAPGNIAKHFENGAAGFVCILEGAGDDAMDLIRKVRDYLRDSGRSNLPQMSSAEENRFLLEEDGVVVAEALRNGTTPEDSEAGSDGATARLWRMFAPSAKLFCMNIKKHKLTR